VRHFSSRRLTWRPRHVPDPYRFGELQDEPSRQTIFPINCGIVGHCTWDSASPRLSGNSVRTLWAPLVPQACRQSWTRHIDPPHAESARWPTPSASQPKHTIQSVAFDTFLSDGNSPRPRGITFNGSACVRCRIRFSRARKRFLRSSKAFPSRATAV